MLNVGAGIGLIRRMKPFVPLSTLKMLYNAIVLPYFDYCSPLWDNCGNTLKNRLQKFQNRAARIITRKSYDVPSVELLAMDIIRDETYRFQIVTYV